MATAGVIGFRVVVRHLPLCHLWRAAVPILVFPILAPLGMKITRPPNSRLEIGFLAPAVLVLFFAADLALRLLPLERLTFRPWEAVALRHEPPAPFRPNQHFEEPRVFGDLAALGNMPQRREYHFQSFSTDGLGFRNPPNFLQSNCPSALLVGSSFSIGASVTDEQTLSVRLSQLSGRGIYNAGGLEPADARSIRALARRLKMNGGWVIYEFLERNHIPRVRPVREHRITAGWNNMLALPAIA